MPKDYFKKSDLIKFNTFVSICLSVFQEYGRDNTKKKHLYHCIQYLQKLKVAVECIPIPHDKRGCIVVRFTLLRDVNGLKSGESLLAKPSTHK